jgi:hypothetical protein
MAVTPDSLHAALVDACAEDGPLREAMYARMVATLTAGNEAASSAKDEVFRTMVLLQRRLMVVTIRSAVFRAGTTGAGSPQGLRALAAFTESNADDAYARFEEIAVPMGRALGAARVESLRRIRDALDRDDWRRRIAGGAVTLEALYAALDAMFASMAVFLDVYLSFAALLGRLRAQCEAGLTPDRLITLLLGMLDVLRAVTSQVDKANAELMVDLPPA